MTKVNVNGITREMTAEEIAALQQQMEAFLPKLSYDEAVNEEIRKKYSISQELAILRQKEEKPEEYAEYYSYCENCKRLIKESYGEV